MIAHRATAWLATAALALGALQGCSEAPSGPAKAPGAGQGHDIHLAVVACGEDRLDETLVMLKSALLSTGSHLTLHLFADDALRPRFAERLDAWPGKVTGRLTLRLYPISYPGMADPKGWFETAKPCASQRLFFPYLIQGTDRVIYVDTDVLFLRPIDDAWRLFERFAPEQLAALAPETESHEDSWYRRFAQHPYFAPFGLNTGFELMDLAKMRERRWRERLTEAAEKYAEKTVWVDQDLQNILFHDAPEQLLFLSCDWNYRPDHCRYMSTCRSAELGGIGVLHGARRAFQDGKEPTFQAVYRVFEQDDLGPEPAPRLAAGVQAALAAAPADPGACRNVQSLFSERLERRADRGSDVPAAKRGEDGFYDGVVFAQLEPWRTTGIDRKDLDRIRATGRRVVHYQIIDHQVYRDRECMFPTRCSGIDHFLREVAGEVPDVDLMVNVQDYPVSTREAALPVLSFSKVPLRHADILYPAWAFWEGGPAVTVIPSWRWDVMRSELLAEAARLPWQDRRPLAFFRGSRTSELRDALVLHSVANGAPWDVRYTLNQSQRDTQFITEELKLEPAPEVGPREHCAYRYLINFDGVAASFRLKNLLACGSTVLYVRPEWIEFFYYALVPWQHYVPLPHDVAAADDTLRMLLANDVLSRQIADNGRAFLEQHLTMRDVSSYWRKLLQEYGALQRFRPERDPGLVRVEDAGA